MSLNICIFGVSGYTGSKLLELLCRHSKVNVSGVFGDQSIGSKLKDIFPKLDKVPDIKISNYLDFNFSNVDLVFSCLPHGEFQKKVIKRLDPKLSIIDLSGDFRLNNYNDYELFYETKHKSEDLQKKFVYGLSEFYRNEISKSKFIANPGCYPTSVLIPLLPLIDKELIENGSHIIIDSKSGVSGAGKKPKIENLFSELNDNFYSYGILSHRHYPEIDQEFKKINKSISFSFIPHLLPVFSGLQSTIYIDKGGSQCDDFINTLKNFYKNSKFIKFFENDKIPKLNDIKNTNNVALKIFNDYSKNKIVIISCIDNLVKGAAGQAIQNMNLMNGFDEQESLI
tara:strand:- start:4131 stop:5150 length:1020 start_codon:yes stop_codon:yes gene_type:complete